MTINDHDQFTGLNAVHVAASEGNVKRLVELMDDGAELDVPALGGSIVLSSSFTSSRSLSLSLSRDFFFSLMMSLRDDDGDDDDDRFFFVCVFVRVFLRGVRGDARGSFLVVAGSSEGEVRERERERERERGWKTRDSSSRTTVLTCALLILIIVSFQLMTKRNKIQQKTRGKLRR